MPNSSSVDNFASLDTHGDPGGVKVVELSGMKPKSANPVTVPGPHFIMQPQKGTPKNLYCKITHI